MTQEIYCYSFSEGSYGEFDEHILSHHTEFSSEQFQDMVNSVKGEEKWLHLSSLVSRMISEFGFKELEIKQEAHISYCSENQQDKVYFMEREE